MAFIHRTLAEDLIIGIPQEEIEERTVMWQNDGENAGHDSNE